MRWTALLCALASCSLAAAPASAAEIVTKPVRIAASTPDDGGAAVQLDGGVTYPTEGCPCPGIVINHGFLGKWQDNREVAEPLAREGYVVLRYSSRGFGQTPGEVDLMGPKETQDLLDAVHWLNDPGNPVVGGMVLRDRIGQFGGSYGGAHAWALARSGDPAVRTTVPTATWTDLYDALLPNGVMLLAYANGFYATGWAPGGALINDQSLSTTNNYSQNVHRWMAEANTGVNLADIRAGLGERSVAGHFDDVKIPVFIIQGLNDGLFSANQAIDAYRELDARGVPARLYLGGIGHPPSQSSLGSAEAQHVAGSVLRWFDHHLKGIDNGIDEEPPIELSRADYFGNRWDGTTRRSAGYPFGTPTRLHLCTTSANGGALSAQPCPEALPAIAANHFAGPGYAEEPVTAEYARELADALDAVAGRSTDPAQLPSTITYDGPVLDEALDLAGVPRLELRVGSAAVLPAAGQGHVHAMQLNPKLYAVAPDGSQRLLTRGAFSEPLDGAGLPGVTNVPAHTVRFDAFGLSTVVPAGHRLRLRLQSSDVPYLRPTTNPFAAVVFAGSAIDLPGADRLVP